MYSQREFRAHDHELRRVEKPWGYEVWWGRSARYMGKVLHINRGESLSLQYHERKEETILLWEGKMCFEHFKEGEEPVSEELRPGDSFHIRPGLRHRMIALEDCDVFEVSTPEVDDVVRLEDRYGRTRE